MSRNRIYLVNPIVDRFRWIAIREDESRWGIKVAQIENATVGVGFGPVPVEWTSETADRPEADFPNFRSNLLCFSPQAKEAFGPLIPSCGEWVRLEGLKKEFYCFHSLLVNDAMDRERTDDLLSRSIYKSIHSPRFVPALHSHKLNAFDIFRIPESISKFFVSENFKSTCDENNFSGLEFLNVELTD